LLLIYITLGCLFTQALEPMLEALCAAALAHAEKAGRSEINEDDLKAVSSKIFTGKAK
jgi:histone H3/H4